MKCRIELSLCLCLFLTFSGLASGQAAEQFRTLVVNDYSGKVALLEMGDKTYIELRRLAEVAHGSIAYEGSRVILTLPGAAASAPASTVKSEEPNASALTRDFIKAGIEEISLMREWASTLANAIQNGYPVNESWVASYRSRAQSGLGLVSAAVSSDGDRNGFQLLQKEFDAVQEWSSKLLEARTSMNAAKYALSPAALQNDPLSQKIVTCGRYLGQMLAGGVFQDDPSCH
jgi:hypothetical protein